uniref:NADH-ubiquinone oxidoreductase chain 6 n=1 Tax=Maccullochella peelii TaxID=135761 RepID=W8ZSU8_9TELE|nr:NADH dehydrogenase subunit 6 [Maccullochella peelii]WJQ22425.1 NADH dehydrogenase subunit 6 [Maccullochella peelii peelii]ALH16679.1 NADH dehydrogenase subunit 6 [Maccullochella peelii]ALH16692.1 NADH dehydrogenase subunit 6 [Maccullochella peelii]ALH16705.1 NADH dehydrogenase subunit 6 [Maccullochella peelii]ALH16731.1 NADH dehydrogenase subunit 6 [Maccullochella peelii]
MVYIMFLFLLGVVFGLMAVASNPSPYFAALGLVVVAGMGCGMLAGYGGSFLSLVLFLIYLGGMLVVFAYSTALVADPYPESWGSRPIIVYMVLYGVVVVFSSSLFLGDWCEFSWAFMEEFEEFSVFRGDSAGVALMYSSGGWVLFISALVLLIALFVVLELTRGLARGALRAV